MSSTDLIPDYAYRTLRIRGRPLRRYEPLNFGYRCGVHCDILRGHGYSEKAGDDRVDALEVLSQLLGRCLFDVDDMNLRPFLFEVLDRRLGR